MFLWATVYRAEIFQHVIYLFILSFVCLFCIIVCVSDICQVPLDIGWCNFFYPKAFYFDIEAGQCSELESGCSSSENAFDSLESCQQQCAKHLAGSVTVTAAAVDGKYRSPLFSSKTIVSIGKSVLLV